MNRPFSVIHGRDKDVIKVLLAIHAVENPYILDCTYNKGSMWKGTDFKSVRMDIDPLYNLDVVGDFTKMLFQDNSFDVIVFDPPHRPIAAGTKSAYAKYNEGELDVLRSGDNVSPLFEPFLQEAKRVLKSDGIVLAKIAD